MGGKIELLVAIHPFSSNSSLFRNFSLTSGQLLCMFDMIPCLRLQSTDNRFYFKVKYCYRYIRWLYIKLTQLIYFNENVICALLDCI